MPIEHELIYSCREGVQRQRLAGPEELQATSESTLIFACSRSGVEKQHHSFPSEPHVALLS
jgi:hypothetical protein